MHRITFFQYTGGSWRWLWIPAVLWLSLSLPARSGETAEKMISPDARFTVGEVIQSDDFQEDSGRWIPELEKGGKVRIGDGRLELDMPAGCTLWFKPPLEGPVMIEYEATLISAGGPNDRVSDLNCFWMARDSRHPEDIFGYKRSGKFSDYNQLLGYYVGQGGNDNTTTRFRRYIGDPMVRPLRPEDDLSAAQYLLVPNTAKKITIVACGPLIQYYHDGKKYFEMTDKAPYTSGWFAFRTVNSHQFLRHFRVYRLQPVAGPAAVPANSPVP